MIEGGEKIPYNPSTQKIATANMVVYYFPDGFAQKHTLFAFKYS